MFTNSKQVLMNMKICSGVQKYSWIPKKYHIYVKISWVQINEHGFKKCPQVEKCLQVKKNIGYDGHELQQVASQWWTCNKDRKKMIA